MLKIYNSLSRKIEDFKPLNPPNVTMYTCGPTVYDFAHIGNFRTYTTSDLLVRTLKYNKYDVKYVMNLTDVGHLTGDNLGDADLGEDRMEKAAKKEKKTAWDVAEFYSDAFLKDYKRLNLTEPLLFAKATDHIQEQIKLVQELEKKGFTYKTTDGVYFDTSKFTGYGQLSSLDQIKEGARVEINPEKRNSKDFALWRLNKTGEKKQMEWESPWGPGVPGWHIECSAMSMKYLGETFDIHVGGMDLKETHHPNEIAQSEAATGKSFVNYWVHGAFILIDGKRMSKSLGNNYKVEDVVSNGFDPLTLRYLYMQAHYRQEMNFTWEAMTAAQNALDKLREIISGWKETPKVGCAEYEQKFLDAINDDLNTSRAIAIMWGLVHSGYPNSAKLESLYKMDEILGLNIKESKNLSIRQAQEKSQKFEIPSVLQKLVNEREELRREKKFDSADEIREKIKKLGFEIQDMESGKVIIKKINQ